MVWSNGKLLYRGKYQIIEEIGSGGFAITYKARNIQLHQNVVIKTPNTRVKSDPNYPKYVQRFIKEGRLLAKLCQEPHPSIVKVIQLFQEGDTYCLVMDFIQGQSLWQLVINQGALPEAEAVEYISQIGAALNVVHQKEIWHLDVTPQNIMLRNDGTAVLIDFGIAGDMSPPSTFSRKFGTEAFAPYELIRKGSRHPTVDIYYLAASLYYAATGKCPAISLYRKYGDEKLVPPKQIVPGISDEMNRAILKGMELEPENRPQSMQEWLKLLKPKLVAQARTSQPVQASPESSGLGNNSFIPRRKLNTKPLLAVGLLAVLSAVGIPIMNKIVSPLPPKVTEVSPTVTPVAEQPEQSSPEATEASPTVTPVAEQPEQHSPEATEASPTVTPVPKQPEQPFPKATEASPTVTPVPKQAKQPPPEATEVSPTVTPVLASKPNLEDNLNLAVEVNYSKLQNLLAQGNWKEADRETRNVMLKVAGREKNSGLNTTSIETFSCTDLRKIDNLWVKYSDGRFGFTVQNRIWESVGSQLGESETRYEEIYEKFGDRVGWRVDKSWLLYNNFTFTPTPTKGHLPSFLWSVGTSSRWVVDGGEWWDWGTAELGKRFSFLSYRLVQCNI